MSDAIFYHAGCPVCVTAEQSLLAVLDPTRVRVRSVDLGQEQQRVTEARAAGVRSVPALVLNGEVLHINHGAELSALE